MDTSQGYINQPYQSEWLCVTVMKLDTALLYMDWMTWLKNG